MRLTTDQIENYYRFFFSDLPEPQIQQKAQSLRDRLVAGNDSLEDRFMHTIEGKTCAAASVQLLQKNVFALVARLDSALEVPALGAIMDDAFTFVRERAGKKLHFRAKMGANHARVAEFLAQRGFCKLNERIEYRSPLADLPDDSGTPLEWKPMADKSEASVREFARVLERCGKGDPDWSPDDNAEELLRSYLDDSSLTGDAECAQVGWLHGKPAAVIVAQVNRETGWSRITYMGVIPEFRSQGLGRWVHRHGFAMMHAQGGTTYHGGTLRQNEPMRRLFDTHGCREFQRLEEWVWEASESPAKS